MANTEHNKKKRRKPRWSDLPAELMELILKNCNFSDQARLRAVCRRWQSIPRVQPIKQLPWLMSYDDQNWSWCKFLDFTYNRTCTININTIKEYCKENNLAYIRICASKSSWLLMSHPMNQSSNSAFFLYSPFTNIIIQLPNLKTSYFWVIATFSTDPTSADCVFFALHNSVDTRTIEISTCRLGDTTWTTHVFPDYFCAINNVVYSEGLFWCATPRGRLATFSVAQGIWNVLESPAKVLLPANYVKDKTYMVESNGDLLLFVMSDDDNSKHLFKLDRLQMAWIMVEDTEDHILFFGRTSLSVPAKAVGGKIHFCWRCANFKHFASLVKEKLVNIWIEPPS